MWKVTLQYFTIIHESDQQDNYSVLQRKSTQVFGNKNWKLLKNNVHKYYIYVCVCARASLFSCLLGLWTIAGKALFKSSFFFIIFLIIIYYAALINKEINKVTEHYTARSYQRDEVIRSTETIQRVSVFLDVLLMEIPGKMWRWKIIRKSNWKTN